MNRPLRPCNTLEQITRNDSSMLSSGVFAPAPESDEDLLALLAAVEPLDYELFVEQQRQALEADQLHELLVFPGDDLHVAVIQRRYRTVRPLAPDKTEMIQLQPHVQECVRQYLSDWMCAHRCYSDLSCGGVYIQQLQHQQQLLPSLDSPAPRLAVLERRVHEYELDGVPECCQIYPTPPQPAHPPTTPATSTASVAGIELQQKLHYLHHHSQQQYTSNGSGKAGGRSGWPLSSSLDSPAPSGGQSRCSWSSSHFDLKHSLSDALLPALLERPAAADLQADLQLVTGSQQLRQLLRPQQLLTLVSQHVRSRLAHSSILPAAEGVSGGGAEDCEGGAIECRPVPPLPREHSGCRLLVKCLRLKLDVEFEPIFASMALYDAGRRCKLSENFYFDMNSDGVRAMLRDHVPYIDVSTLTRSCVFDVTNPSPDLFLVVRLEKVLQGDASEALEPYLKDDKSREKVQLGALSYCQRLGRYRMPFAWTAIYLINIVNGLNSLERDSAAPAVSSPAAGDQTVHANLERKSSQSGFDHLRRRATASFSSMSAAAVSASCSGDVAGSPAAGGVFSPPRRASSDRRAGADQRGQRLTVSGDQLGESLRSFRPVTLTVSSFFKQEPEKLRDEDLYKHLNELKRPAGALKKLKCIGGSLKLDISPAPDQLKFCLSPELAKIRPFPDDKCRPCKEVLEFPADPVLVPHFVYRNLMFVAPKHLNFANYPNKPGVSARNIAVKVQFMAGETASSALPVLFGRSSCPEFASEAYTTVVYHNRMPDFYDEFKIRLPANLTDEHHLLFTFYHISCNRKSEQPSIEIPLGYTWLPVFRDGRLNTGEFSLPVLLELPTPNYSYISADVELPGVKWIDGHRPLFTVVVSANSSVHPQDRFIDDFLSMCRVLETGVVPPRIGENNLEAELNRSIEQLNQCDVQCLVCFLPLLCDRLLQLMVRPPIVAGQQLNTGQPCFEAFARLAIRLTSLPGCHVDQHGRSELLMKYIRYQCSLPGTSVDPSASSSSLTGSGISPTPSPLFSQRTSSLPRRRAFSRSTSNPNMAAVSDTDMEVGHIMGRAADRSASLRTGVSQELLVSPRVSACRKIVHEEVALQWVLISAHSPSVATQSSWFFFELIVKSMMCHLASVGRLDSHRRYRFPERFCDDVVALLNFCTSEIINQQDRQPHEIDPSVVSLNTSLAFFVNDLFSLMDRGFVMRLVYSYCHSMASSVTNSPDPTHLLHLILDFVRIVCSHEHYFALNLPFCTPFSGGSVSASNGGGCNGGIGVQASSPTPSVCSTGSHCSIASTATNQSTAVGPPGGGCSEQQLRRRYSVLSVEHCQHHYLTALVLRLLQHTLTLSVPSLHQKAVGLLLELLRWHDADPRFLEAAARGRAALLYLPLLAVVLDSLPRLYPFSSGCGYSMTDLNGRSRSPPSNATLTRTAKPAQRSSQTAKTCIAEGTSRDLLLCVLWLLKNVRVDVLASVWSSYSLGRFQQLLDLLHICIACFEYKGREYVVRLVAGCSPAVRPADARSYLEQLLVDGRGSARHELMRRRASPLPHQVAPPSSSSSNVTMDRLRWKKELTAAAANWRTEADSNPGCPTTSTGDGVGEHAALLEATLCAESSLVVLDSLQLAVHALSADRRQQLSLQQQQQLLAAAVRVLLHALSVSQSGAVLGRLLAGTRWLAARCAALLFDEQHVQLGGGSGGLCADLCSRLLQHCSSAVSTVRSQAAGSLYLLMRQNFEIGNNFARVKMQLTMSLSALVGTMSNFNEEFLRRSLKTVLEYAVEDHELRETSFPGQVNDLVFNLHMILSDTVKMKEYQEDHEMLVDLMYRIAKGYQNSPDLRITWLKNMASKHSERGQYAEAAMCYVQSAALVSEYLAMIEPKTHLPVGAVRFETISPNTLEESAVSDDVISPDEEGICTGQHFSEAGLLQLLQQAAACFWQATLYEAVGSVYSLVTPIIEHDRDYYQLSDIYSKLQETYDKAVALRGRRLFWSYYRVAFFGFKFGDLDGAEFVYKEPALTKLAEISDRLETFYTERFGAANVQIIKTSHRVDTSQLNPEIGHIQITFVEPHFDLWELRQRTSEFERNFNIKEFIFSTPFTVDGRTHGDLNEQHKRKTILTVSNTLPYVKTRVPVVSRREIVLTPIQVAIEDVGKKTKELAAACSQNPPDTKMLQMVLQGCIGTTVNQGPLEIANVFLQDLFNMNKEATDLQRKLRICFKDFSKKCLDALRKNRSLIKSDQHEYQRELEKNYQRFVDRLKPILSPHQTHALTLSKSRSRDLGTGHRQQLSTRPSSAAVETSPFV